MEDTLTQDELWAMNDFGGAALGDPRRTMRLVRVAAGLARDLGSAISQSCGRSGAQAVSRLLARPEVTVESVTRPHQIATYYRCLELDRILAVQDTTHLDFGGRESLVGAGPISSSADSLGFMQHTTLAVTEEGTPIGILGTQIWARDPEQTGRKNQRRSRLVVDKESHKWIGGLESAEAWTPPGMHVVVVGDRESDIFALLAAPRRANTDLLIRVAQDRVISDITTEDGKILHKISQALSEAEALGTKTTHVPKRKSQPERDAVLEIKAVEVWIEPPVNRTPDIPNRPIQVWVVEAKELNAPAGVEPLHWVLMTTRRTESFESAKLAVRDYEKRWVVEEFHHVLKSGCRVEHCQIETAERMEPAIAISSVLAVRLLNLAKSARETPDAPASNVCTEQEAKVLEECLRRQGERVPESIRTIRDFVMGVAILGKFSESRRTGRPGPKVLWRGLRRLADLVTGYSLATASEFR